MNLPVARSIFRSFIRLNGIYAAEGIPQPAWLTSDIKSVLSEGLLSFKTATAMLKGMNDRLHVLKRAGNEARQAMSEWRVVLTRHHNKDDPGCGIEDASMLLARINARYFDGIIPGFEEGEDTSWGSEESARCTLDHWANELRQGRPDLYPIRQPSAHQESVYYLASHLFAPDDVRGRARVYSHPIEWVYEGTGPLLIPEVVRRGKGAPIALAAITCLLGRRLGLRAFPIALSRPNEDQGSIQLLFSDLSSQGQDHSMSQAVFDAAQRHKGRSAYVSPPVEDWGVVLPSSQHNQDPIYLDLSNSSLRKIKQDASCIVLSQREMEARHPQTHIDPRIDPKWRLSAFSASLVRSMMVAHQRRGESDLVSIYLYQLLALDHKAIEWSEMVTEG